MTTFIEPFAEAVQCGDLVALKRPNRYHWDILAVGEVMSKYLHREIFEDVEGWPLQHCRQVRWKVPSAPATVAVLRRGTLCRVNHPQALDTIKQIWSSGHDFPSLPLPPETKVITVDEVVESLIVDGLPGQSAELMTNTIWRLRRMAKPNFPWCEIGSD